MVMTSLVEVTSRIGRIMKNGLHIFERGKNLLQNGILHFVFKLTHSSEIVLQSLHRRKTVFSKRAWHLKGYER